jgi:hypothetical protein
MSMYGNYSCCQTPYYGYDMSNYGCGCQDRGCNDRGSTVYVILVLFILCAFAKRSCLEFDDC